MESLNVETAIAKQKTGSGDFQFSGSLANTRREDEQLLEEELEEMKFCTSATKPNEIRIQNVQIQPNRILDRVLANNTPLYELKLQDIDIVPQECLKLAMDPRVANLNHLDLSCNPIQFKGLCNLLDLRKSHLQNLKHLELFSCELEIGFQEKLKYNHIILKELEYLNLSYNDLCTQKSTKSSPGSLSVYLSPKFGLFQESLESLYLVDIGLNKP